MSRHESVASSRDRHRWISGSCELSAFRGGFEQAQSAGSDAACLTKLGHEDDEQQEASTRQPLRCSEYLIELTRSRPIGEPEHGVEHFLNREA
jgi:hypothetical protein